MQLSHYAVYVERTTPPKAVQPSHYAAHSYPEARSAHEDGCRLRTRTRRRRSASDDAPRPSVADDTSRLSVADEMGRPSVSDDALRLFDTET